MLEIDTLKSWKDFYLYFLFSVLEKIISVQYQDKSWCWDQYQESWLWTCLRPIPIPVSLTQWVHRTVKEKGILWRNLWDIIGQGGYALYRNIFTFGLKWTLQDYIGQYRTIQDNSWTHQDNFWLKLTDGQIQKWTWF